MDELAVPALTFLSVVSIGSAVLVARAARRDPLRARLGETVDQFGIPQGGSGKPLLRRTLESVGSKVSSRGPSAGLRQQLTRAGFHGSQAATLYLGAKALLFLAGLLGLAGFLLPLHMSLTLKGLSIFAGAALLSFMPNLVVGWRYQSRRGEIRRHLPDALDLLEVSVSSGMGMDAAWNSVADEIRTVSTHLASEMALANLEIHLGASREVAMRNMSARTGAEEISSLVAVLVQSERFGTSMADALRTFAASMREARSTIAEVAAEKMAVKILFPMVVFIFPAILIVTVGPAVIIISDLLGGG